MEQDNRFARIRLGDGSWSELRPGDVIGTGAKATLRIADPEMGPAHAVVTESNNNLYLHAIRGLLWVSRRPYVDVSLAPGVRVALSSSTSFEVRALHGKEDVDVEEWPERPALRLELAPDQAFIGHGDGPRCELHGDMARLLWILHRHPTGIDRQTLHRHLWPGRGAQGSLTVLCQSIRALLQQHGVRPDIVASWNGRYWLNKRPADAVVPFDP